MKNSRFKARIETELTQPQHRPLTEPFTKGHEWVCWSSESFSVLPHHTSLLHSKSDSSCSWLVRMWLPVLYDWSWKTEQWSVNFDRCLLTSCVTDHIATRPCPPTVFVLCRPLMHFLYMLGGRVSVCTHVNQAVKDLNQIWLISMFVRKQLSDLDYTSVIIKLSTNLCHSWTISFMTYCKGKSIEIVFFFMKRRH